MERAWSLEEVVRDDRSVVTVGTFDGVHRGHLAILDYLVTQARARNGRPVVVTFDPHPRSIVHDEEVALLSTPGERAEICAARHVNRFVMLPFDRELASMTPRDFVLRVLVERIGLQAIVVGHDHAFGRGRTGNLRVLEELGAEFGFGVDVLPAQAVDDRVVSSSAIRHCLADQGDVRSASEMLGRRYSITGTVVVGARRGRVLGFATANLVPTDARKLVPLQGVYAVRVLAELPAATFGAMMNIGRRPTFEESEMHLEAHLFDFDGDLYGQQLRVEFVERMRPERRFPSIDALIAQLREDEARCRAILRGVS